MIAMISLSNISQMNFSIVNSILNKLQIKLAENNFTEIEKLIFVGTPLLWSLNFN